MKELVRKYYAYIIGFLAVVIVSSAGFLKAKKFDEILKLSPEEKYEIFLSEISEESDSGLRGTVAHFSEKYSQADYNGLDRAYLASSKIEIYKRELDDMCVIEYNINRARYLRTEVRRLMEIGGLFKIHRVEYGYQCPEDLFYGFLNFNNIYTSQSAREHYKNNGLLATDVATGGRKEKLYAPDLYNQEIEWTVSAIKYDNSTVGKSLEFISRSMSGASEYKILFGHVNDWNRRNTVKTGEEIGIVGGCGDAPNEGVSSGCHIHIEYYFWDKIKNDWVIFEYKFEKSNRHQEFVDDVIMSDDFVASAPEKKCREVSGSRYATPNITDEWFFRDPLGRWKGANGYYPNTEANRLAAYQADFRVNCQGDCTHGSGGKLTTGYHVACDPNIKLGTKFKLHGREFMCLDRGGAVKDAKRGGKMAIDFYINKNTEWNEFSKYLSGTACLV